MRAEEAATGIPNSHAANAMINQDTGINRFTARHTTFTRSLHPGPLLCGLIRCQSTNWGTLFQNHSTLLHICH